MQLLEINTQNLSPIIKQSIDELKYQTKEIIKTSEYKTFVLIKLFSAYYGEIKKYIFSGYNVVLDESLISPGKSYDIFISCIKEQQEIERVSVGIESSYRIPGFTLENFALSLSEDDILLQKMIIEEMRHIIDTIAIE